jgi:P-type Cu2+ transporter
MARPEASAPAAVTSAVLLAPPCTGQPARCLHCGQPVRGGVAVRGYCSDACGARHRLLTSMGLERYYELGGGAPPAARPVRDREARGDRAWIAPLARRVASAEVMRHLALDVRGLRSRGCTWLIEELFRREPGRVEIAVCPPLARVELWVARDFGLDRFVRAVEQFGYELGPSRTDARTRSTRPFARSALCLAVADAAFIAGSGRPRIVVAGLVALAALALWTAAAALLPALRALRRAIAPELPACLGLACALAGAVADAICGQLSPAGGAAVALLVALALGGRALEGWILARRARDLADDGLDAIVCRRIRGGRVELVSCRHIRRGDDLLIAPGELVPVEAAMPPAMPDADPGIAVAGGGDGSGARRLAPGETVPPAMPDADPRIAVAGGGDGSGARRLAPGETVPPAMPDADPRIAVAGGGDGSGARRLAPGETVPPGAWNAGATTVRVTAARPFAPAALFPAHAGDRPRTTPTAADRAVRWALLLAAATGALFWAGRGARALDVAAAILLASPPAALALAEAHLHVAARLRREGLIVRRHDFLARARAVRRVALDKLGTLADAGAELRFPEGVARLSGDDRAALHHLAAHSRHPRCVAVCRALAASGTGAFVDDAPVREEPCRGVEADIAGRRYRLGAPRWAVEHGAAPAPGLGFSRDGRLLVWLVADEPVRPGAAAELAAIRARGVEPWLLSSDAPARVRAVAAEVGIPRERARGAMQPDDKAAWLAAQTGRDTLFLGDGLNDGAVGAGAIVTGTPSAGRPLCAAPSDFYLVARGLAPVALALDAARALDTAAQRSRRAACACSVAAVLAALAGLATPLVIAACMPLAALAIARSAAPATDGAARGGPARVAAGGARPARPPPRPVLAAHS